MVYFAQFNFNADAIADYCSHDENGWTELNGIEKV